VTGNGVFRPHHTGAEMVVLLGPTAEIGTSVDGGLPILEVAWGSITLLLMPNTASSDAPIMRCDVDRARDLHEATSVYLAAMQDLWATQQSSAAQAATTSSATSAASCRRRRSGRAPSRACPAA